MDTIKKDVSANADGMARALESSGYRADFSPQSLREAGCFFDGQSHHSVAKLGGLLSLILLLAFASVPLWADELQLGQDFGVAAEPKTDGPLAPRLNLYSDFRNRLAVAIESRDLDAIRALYQTNGVTIAALKLEMVQWRQLLGGESNVTVSCYFKELGTLPPQAREVWGAQAHRLTKHEVTHLVFIHTGTAVRMILPLIAVDGRLRILPSDEGKTGMHIQPDVPANGSQPSP